MCLLCLVMHVPPLRKMAWAAIFNLYEPSRHPGSTLLKMIGRYLVSLGFIVTPASATFDLKKKKRRHGSKRLKTASLKRHFSANGPYFDLPFSRYR